MTRENGKERIALATQAQEGESGTYNKGDSKDEHTFWSCLLSGTLAAGAMGTDAKLMQEMGVQVVRMAEFSWFKMEPQEGLFQFEWLEEAVALLNQYGIKTILGTPTAAPPAWMIEKNPEIQPIDHHGRRRYFGGRHHNCHSNKAYRVHIKRFVTAYAQRFAENPGVIGWQIDNELGNSHEDLCMCGSCRLQFQRWLAVKYRTIEALNDAWGTAFWSQGYHRFSQIIPPLITAAGENPSALLDWKCYCSDLIVNLSNGRRILFGSTAPISLLHTTIWDSIRKSIIMIWVRC